jgi:beta-lactamase class A
MISRRRFMTIGTMMILPALATNTRNSFASPPNLHGRTSTIDKRLRELEAAARGRLGVHIVDTGSGQEYGHRSDERFMMLRTFNLLASALVLHRADAGHDSLQRRITYTQKALVPWSPITEKHVDEGMTLAELCHATITVSDNTAANLILSSYGGPAALTAFARQLGDNVTRLDRTEPELNEFRADRPELDTTTPRAMARSMEKVVLGDVLSADSRHLLQQWLLGNTTGERRLKAGLPKDWRIGDKTGTNAIHANDIGIVWPPGRAPLLVTAYLADSPESAQVKDATLQGVGQLLAELGA